MAKLIPIHLTKEGYDKVEVAFDREVDGLEAQAYISDIDDWIVRIDFYANVKEATEDPVDVRFTVRVICTEDKIVDTVSRGILRIEPAPLGAEI